MCTPSAFFLPETCEIRKSSERESPTLVFSLDNLRYFYSIKINSIRSQVPRRFQKQQQFSSKSNSLNTEESSRCGRFNSSGIKVISKACSRRDAETDQKADNMFRPAAVAANAVNATTPVGRSTRSRKQVQTLMTSTLEQDCSQCWIRGSYE